MRTEFTHADNLVAQSQGWLLADDNERGLEIQRFDDADMFDDDTDALFWVRIREVKGDDLAHRALEVIRESKQENRT